MSSSTEDGQEPIGGNKDILMSEKDDSSSRVVNIALELSSKKSTVTQISKVLAQVIQLGTYMLSSDQFKLR